jgi:hypothetical protein
LIQKWAQLKTTLVYPEIIIPSVFLLLSIVSLYFILKPKKLAPSLIKAKLVEKNQITHDTIIFTFLLPPHKKTLGLRVGEHI